MEQKEAALRIINREIRACEKKQQQLKAELELNGNIKLNDDVSKYENIVANLAKIKSAVEKGQKSVELDLTEDEYIPWEIQNTQIEMCWAGYDISL